MGKIIGTVSWLFGVVDYFATGNWRLAKGYVPE